MTKKSFKELFDIFKYPLFLLIIYLAAYPLYEYWWTDVAAHFLGGLAIAVSWCYVFKYTGFLEYFKNCPATAGQFLIIIALVVFIGVLWEIFEVMLDKIIGFRAHESWQIDTMGDLVMDMVGAGVGFLFIKQKN